MIKIIIVISTPFLFDQGFINKKEFILLYLNFNSQNVKHNLCVPYYPDLYPFVSHSWDVCVHKWNKAQINITILKLNSTKISKLVC